MKKTIHHLAYSPYRFLLAAAVLAAVFCLIPSGGDVPNAPETTVQQEAAGVAAGADLSVRTQQGAYLHRTMTYAPCGHSVQRREALPQALVGLSHAALEAQIGQVVPGAKVTGFGAQEVDVALKMDMPCPLHWVLRAGEDGHLQVCQNRTGDALETVRSTEIETASLDEQAREEALAGIVFDDVQALEGYLESLSS